MIGNQIHQNISVLEFERGLPSENHFANIHSNDKDVILTSGRCKVQAVFRSFSEFKHVLIV